MLSSDSLTLVPFGWPFHRGGQSFNCNEMLKNSSHDRKIVIKCIRAFLGGFRTTPIGLPRNPRGSSESDYRYYPVCSHAVTRRQFGWLPSCGGLKAVFFQFTSSCECSPQCFVLLKALPFTIIIFNSGDANNWDDFHKFHYFKV